MLPSPLISVKLLNLFAIRNESKSKQPGYWKRQCEPSRLTQWDPEPWTDDEEIALSMAWVDNNDQVDHSLQFWLNVCDNFHTRMSRKNYRSIDLLMSKWRDIRYYVQKFHRIYQRTITKSLNWRVKEVINFALTGYYFLYHSEFRKLICWYILTEIV